MRFLRIRLFLLGLLSGALLCFASCAQKPAQWQKYTYPEYDGYLYLAHTPAKGGTLHLALCGNFSGIEASVRIQHACTQMQFAALGTILAGQGLSYVGDVSAPDVTGYPDLSAYISFVFSSDELDELWKSYGLDVE